jgi:hypothetical protein
MKKETQEPKWWHNNGWILPVVIFLAIGVIMLPEKGSRHEVQAVSSPTAKQQTAPQDQPEKRVKKVASLIAGIEKESDKLRKIVESKKNIDPNLKKMMLGTFEIVKINRDNRQRNYAGLLVAVKQDRMMKVDNPNYFFYDLLTSVENECAVYEPPKKTIGIWSDFDPTSKADMAVFFHEMQHVVQDNRTRVQLRSQQEFDEYMAFFNARSSSGEHVVHLADEATAYALELELINLLSGDYLKNQVISGKAIDLEEVAKKLGTTPERVEMIKTVIAAAHLFYPKGLEGGTIPAAFVDYWAGIYNQLGYRIIQRRV